MERLLNNNHDGIDLPTSIIVDLILPFVDRKTWNNLILTNREIYQASKEIEPPWPSGKLSVDHGDFIDFIGYVAFSSDGKYFILYTTSGSIHVWHKRIGPYASLCTTYHHANRHLRMSSMASSPSENLLLTASRDQLGAVLQFWDIASLSVVNEVLIPHAMATMISSCVFSPDGRLVACNCIFSNHLHIYSASNAVCIKTIVTNEPLTIVGFSPDSQTIVAGVRGRVIRVWDVAGDDDTAFEDMSPWLLGTLLTQRGRLPFSPQGQSLIIGTASANICKLAQYQNAMWVVNDLLLAMEVEGLYFIFSPGGRLLAARKMDGILALWDPGAGKLVQALGVCRNLNFLAFSGNGRMLAVAEHLHVSFWAVGI
jgi:WD40 repeat protein